MKDKIQNLLQPYEDLLTNFKNIGPLVLFGGAPRDLHFLSVENFKSDLDFVIDCKHEELLKFCKPYKPVVNKFNGLRFQFKGRTIDIWTLDNTWNISQGFVTNNGFQSLLQTTYFSRDSIYYDLNSEKIIHPPNYSLDLNNKQVRLINPNTPYPKNNLMRTIKLLIKNQISINWDLAVNTEKLLCTHSSVLGKKIHCQLQNYIDNNEPDAWFTYKNC